MYDVARIAGVSQSTVSRVLSSDASAVLVGGETRQKIFDAVQQLGYRPNWTARSLRSLETKLIAVLIADISNSIYHPIVRAVQDVARIHGYDVLIANSDHEYEKEKHFCEAVLRRPVDGIVMVPYHLTHDEIDQLITLTGAQIVVFGDHIQHPLVDYVWVDDEKATYEGVTWLHTARGHRRIGFIGVPEDMPPGPRRWRGFQGAMETLGLTIEPELVSFSGDFTLEGGQRIMTEMLASAQPPFALFACNDLMAIGAITQARKLGYSVPQDIAIMGFDDIQEAQLVTPALTTIAQRPKEIGARLTELLFDRIEDRETGPARKVQFAYELVVRESA
jgi:LacI family transcriptional regulator